MFYTVYKITNNLNGKYYIGMHQTKKLDDGYMGSGKLIKLAIAKHGVENFSKEILHVFDNEEDMRAKEAELVVISEDSYNLCDGGKGGFGYLNRSGKALRIGAVWSEESRNRMSKAKLGTTLSDEARRKISENNGMKDPEVAKKLAEALTGKTKSEEHKRKIAEAIKRKHQEKRGGS